MIDTRLTCPCCGYRTLPAAPGHGSHEICPVCFWEDDEVQLLDPALAGGANMPSLIEAQRAFRDIGAVEARLRPHVRPPAPWERPDPEWRPASAWDVAQARRPVDLEDEDPVHLDAWYYWRQRPAGPEVPLLEWPSREMLTAHLEAAGPRVLRLEPGRYAAQGFHSLRVGFGETGSEVAVVSEIHAGPGAFALAGGDVVVVGHDRALTWVRPEPLAVAAEHALAGVFFEFMAVDSEDEVVVIHELGAVRVTATGEVRWSVDTHVVTEARQDAEGRLCLRELESGRERVFSLATGSDRDR